jgi:predicted lactoylglutathione lyase
MLNFEMASEEEVREATNRAAALGATVRKAPYLTPYDYYQSVLQDPEGNVFRLNHVRAPR